MSVKREEMIISRDPDKTSFVFFTYNKLLSIFEPEIFLPFCQTINSCFSKVFLVRISPKIQYHLMSTCYVPGIGLSTLHG